MSHHADGLSGRGLMPSLEQDKDRSFNKMTGNWVMNCRGIVDNIGMLATQRHLFRVAGTDVSK